MAANLRSINGATAEILIGDKVAGYATGITVTEFTALQRIDVLGQIDTKDIEPIGRMVNGTIGFMRMILSVDSTEGGGAVAQDLSPSHSTDSYDAQTRTEQVLSYMDEGFSLLIRDSVGDKDLRYKIEGCRPSSHTFSLSRGTLMGVNITFEALHMAEMDQPALA